MHDWSSKKKDGRKEFNWPGTSQRPYRYEHILAQWPQNQDAKEIRALKVGA